MSLNDFILENLTYLNDLEVLEFHYYADDEYTSNYSYIIIT